jgi:hypothetical protein
LLPLAIAGCPTEPQQRVKDPAPVEDEWSRIPASKEWLYATGEFSGPHKAECDHVLEAVKGEEACRGSLCEHGRDLAAEWVTRCTPYADAQSVELAKHVQVELTTRANESPTECGTTLDTLVRDGCTASTCYPRAQRWATRCGKSEGTPLLLQILQRIVDRHQEPGAEKVELDARTCEELRHDVIEAGRCKDRFVCQEAIPRVETYRDRCEGDGERPTIATAVSEMTVLVGGGKPTAPILTRAGSPSVVPSDVPVALADGSGGVIFVCEDRASELLRYVGSRRTCQGGKLVVARAFPTANGVEVRSGALDFPDDATFFSRYPTIVAAGELEVRDREAAAMLSAELGKAAAAEPAEGARLLGRAVILYTLAIKRSPVVRAELAKRDADLAPAMKELAKAKLAAARNFRAPPAEAAGVLARARTRAFADVAADGTVQADAPGHAFTLDTTALLPRGMEAYLSVFKSVRGAKLAGRVAAAEKARAERAAGECGAAEKKLQESKKALVSCNFALEACDEGKHAALLKRVDEARATSESAFHEVESARTADPADADAIQRAAEAAGCREPWW